MEEAVEERGNRGRIAEQLGPVVDWPIGGHQGAGPFVATHDQLEQVLRRRVREFAHAEIVDDQQVCGAQGLEMLFACAVESGVGELFEQDVGFAVDDPVSLLDGGEADGLGQMALPVPGGPRKSASSCFSTKRSFQEGACSERPRGLCAGARSAYPRYWRTAREERRGPGGS